MFLIFEFVLRLQRVIKEIYKYWFCESVTYTVAEDASRLSVTASKTRQCCFSGSFTVTVHTQTLPDVQFPNRICEWKYSFLATLVAPDFTLVSE